MSDGNRDRAEQSPVHDYEDWWGQLDGQPSVLPANRVGLGFYARRERSGSHTGIAIWLGDHGRPVVKSGHATAFTLATAAEEEDFSYRTLAWCVAVPEDAYVAWAASGTWPDGTLLDRPRPKRERSVKAATIAAAPAPARSEASDPDPSKSGAVFVRLYATIDPPSSGMAFMARAIAPTKTGGEGVSVGFYAATQQAAAEKAQAWIVAERECVERLHGAAARRRAPSTATPDQPETAGAVA